MPAMETYVAFDTPTLVMLSDLAREHSYSRTLSKPFLTKVDSGGRHVIAFTFIHNDDHVRATMLIAMKDQEEPAHAVLDIELNTYLELPRYGYDIEGNVVTVPRVVTAKKDRASLFGKKRVS